MQAFAAVAHTMPGEIDDKLPGYMLTVAQEQPVLGDVDLMQRVDDFNRAVTELANFIAGIRNVGRPDEQPPDWPRYRLEYTLALSARASWLGHSLAAHRVGCPLPSRDGLPDLPTLPSA